MESYLWLIPAAPLISCVVLGLFGKRHIREQSHWVAWAGVAVSFFLSLKAATVIIGAEDGTQVVQKAYKWIEVGGFSVDVGFLLDPLSSVMILVVSGVGLLIHIYSAGYMRGDPGYYRYFSYLCLFTFSMLLLVLADNFLLLFVGWELVGLCSYLLIGFWFEREAPPRAGQKAFIVNRIGDMFFILAMLAIFAIFGSLGFNEVFGQIETDASVRPWFLSDTLPVGQILGMETPILGFTVATVITLCLFIGATGKSAQIPLYVWLPDAMEGPTPVSALIHAATMVTAGVYMVVRCGTLMTMSPATLELIAVVGAATAFMAATIALVQNDIKKVLAYSTISQLGYMFMAVGVGAFSVGIFHLMTHAFFKALLFLGAGSVIHAMAGTQDMRQMGDLREKMPWTFYTMLFGCLAIAGFPFTAGFFSKDAILWNAFSTGSIRPAWLSTVIFVVAVVTALLTAFYMFRLLSRTFFGKSRAPEDVRSHIHESPKVMVAPLVILAVLSVIGGWVGMPESLGFFPDYFHDFLEPVMAHATIFHIQEMDLHAAEFRVTVVCTLLVLATMLTAVYLYTQRTEFLDRMKSRVKGVHRTLSNKYYMDEIYNVIFVRGLIGGSRVLRRTDESAVDGLVNGIARFLSNLSQGAKGFQSGDVQRYGFAMGLAVVLLLFVLLWLDRS